jgi:hypothetical protein
MGITIEPVDGTELDRFVTALLNATGAVHRAIHDCATTTSARGVDLIDRTADRIRDAMVCLAEHHDDEELAFATWVLAEASVLLATELGISEIFRETG